MVGSNPLIIFPMSLSVKGMLDRDLSVKLPQLVGSLLVFVISEHWLAKKELKSSAFSLKSNIDLHTDAKMTGEWAFQWKMNFNPDPAKQPQEMIFSSKVQTTNHPPLFFNENGVPQTTLQKHLGMFLNSKLTFSEHLKTIF